MNDSGLQDLDTEIMFKHIQKELQRARQKFPVQDVWRTLSALAEEVGELNKAILEHNYEPHKGVTPDQIYMEAVQTAVMAIRVALDCPYKTKE